MKQTDRMKNYSKQIGVDAKGAFKSNATKSKLTGKLTPRQQRRLRKKAFA